MSKMPERMTKEEAKIQRAIEAARIAKQTLLEETRDRMPLEVDEEEVKVKRPKAENVTIKVPNQDKEGYGLAGVEEEYNIKKQSSSRKLNIEKLIGNRGDVDELKRMLEKEFGKVKDGSTSSYNPSFIIPIDLIVYAESTRGNSEDYTINAIEFMKK